MSTHLKNHVMLKHKKTYALLEKLAISLEYRNIRSKKPSQVHIIRKKRNDFIKAYEIAVDMDSYRTFCKGWRTRNAKLKAFVESTDARAVMTAMRADGITLEQIG